MDIPWIDFLKAVNEALGSLSWIREFDRLSGLLQETSQGEPRLLVYVEITSGALEMANLEAFRTKMAEALPGCAVEVLIGKPSGK